MFADRSQGTWQITADALDCLTRQINPERGTVTEPFYRSLLLYFMLSSLLFSVERDANLFHQWFSCWPCRLLYLQQPLNLWSYEVIASWGETWGNNTVIGTRSVIGKNKCSDNVTFVTKKIKSSRRNFITKTSVYERLLKKEKMMCLKHAL